MHEDMLVGAAQTAEEIIRIYASNYIPKRTFRGPVFLSGYGLWVDWRDNWALNRAIEKIMMRFEGQHSIFEIAEQVGLDYQTVRDYVEKFRAKGFVVPQPIPSEAQTA
jgi:aminopeptidase-like protein